MLKAVAALLGEAPSGIRHPSAMGSMRTEGSMTGHSLIEPFHAVVCKAGYLVPTTL